MTELLEHESPSVDMGRYAEQAYLSYAMSVVMGRALPMLQDGQKPVQRRILYAMHRMGLSEKTKPVKSARVVGDVIGKYHPHGDSSVYDAMVRVSQDFSLRYPLVDGQGNFGSRDGDSAAAMRYTECRLTPIADLLLGELDQGTVDFAPNYDGMIEEPLLLPARLPVLLLNGASGIAVGMATEIPSHNLTEVANACEHLIKHPEATLEDIMTHLPGPDFPCGATIISTPEDVAKAYSTGRGAIRVRANWTVEPLARGQWQLVITELPPDTSTAKVMAEIETLTNPQIKPGKKTLSQDQLNLKSLVLSVLERISDDSDGEHPVRLVIEPRSSRLKPEEIMQVLLAHTSLEANVSLNMVTIGQDARPQQKGLLQILQEWVAFRYVTVTRRTQTRLAQVKARMHILEGRLAVFLHIDEVIAVIRGADEPKTELMARFSLSELQATDILEIRLRQLARLERIKIEGELEELKKEALFLEGLLSDKRKMTQQILKELDGDRKKFGDARRTLIEPAEKVTTLAAVAVSNDPVTLIISKAGWLRARAGHKIDVNTLTWKPGDEALAIFEARSNQTVVLIDHTGRAYNIAASAFPNGRGDGAPASSLVELNGNRISQVLLLEAEAHYLLACSDGYGFICPGTELATRQKAGKALITVGEKAEILQPAKVTQLRDTGEAIFASTAGKLLVTPLNQMKVMAKGRGVQLMSLGAKDHLTLAGAVSAPLAVLTLQTQPHGKKQATEITLDAIGLKGHHGNRARAGAALPYKAVPLRILAVTLDETKGAAEAPTPAKPETPSFGDEDLI